MMGASPWTVLSVNVEFVTLPGPSKGLEGHGGVDHAVVSLGGVMHAGTTALAVLWVNAEFITLYSLRYSFPPRTGSKRRGRH